MYKVTHYQEDMSSIIDFYNQSNYLWMDNFIYTRQAIISAVANLPDLSSAIDRLKTNKNDISRLLKYYYADGSVEMFANSLDTYITLVVSLLSAIINKTDITAIVEQLTSNSDELASWLSSMNSHMWPKATIMDLWNQNIGYISDQANARMVSDWVGDMTAADESHYCISQLGCLFAKGIVYQNLEQFSVAKPKPVPVSPKGSLKASQYQTDGGYYDRDHTWHDHDWSDHDYDHDHYWHDYHWYDRDWYDNWYDYDEHFVDYPFRPYHPYYPYLAAGPTSPTSMPKPPMPKPPMQKPPMQKLRSYGPRRPMPPRPPFKK